MYIPFLDAKGEKLKKMYWVDLLNKDDMTQTSLMVNFDVPVPVKLERITFRNETIWFIMPKGQV